ncbi:Ig-like domain-containing protein [Motilibacter aurantiacus]|uniref:Ig-like domain-containing protein n=1 Tax=Motilibacter aurantiacus TaxID=2714955 RepID=UPI00140A5993|nr:Ig-like domain-containing protein [Motilibacter aurantiacus]NHC44412.1 hypothetical protein [Motilibacter aurantiacus]
MGKHSRPRTPLRPFARAVSCAPARPFASAAAVSGLAAAGGLVLSALAAAPASALPDGTVYAVAASQVYAVDEPGGALVPLPGALPFATDAAARQPGTGLLYVVSATPGPDGRFAVAAYDPAAQLPAVLPATLDVPLTGLAFAPDGRLHGIAGDSLVEIDPTTGAELSRSPVAGLPSGARADLAYAPDGTAYVLTDAGLFALPPGATVAAYAAAPGAATAASSGLAVTADGRVLSGTASADGSSLVTDAQGLPVATGTALALTDLASEPGAPAPPPAAPGAGAVPPVVAATPAALPPAPAAATSPATAAPPTPAVPAPALPVPALPAPALPARALPTPLAATAAPVPAPPFFTSPTAPTSPAASPSHLEPAPVATPAGGEGAARPAAASRPRSLAPAGTAALPAAAPTARPDRLTLPAGERTGTATVLANDALHDVSYPVVVAKEPDHGSAEVLSDGRVRYTAERGFSGDDSLTYALVGPDGEPSVAVLRVSVPPAAMTVAQSAPARLARTGADVRTLASAAIVLLAAGAGLCAVGRRRRQER